MPTFSPASNQAEFVPPEPGWYIATCTAIEDAPPKQFGPGVKWIFTLADPQTGVVFQDAEGKDLEVWQYTSVKMSPKARARPLVEALYGRPLDVDSREVPDARQLIGKSMLTLLTHENGDDGSPRARLTSCRPYMPPSAAAVAAPSEPATSPPTADSGTDLREQVEKAIRRAHILETPNHLDWLKLDLHRLSDDELALALEEIQADILAS